MPAGDAGRVRHTPLDEGGGSPSLAFRPSFNRWRGSEEPELKIEDAKPGAEAVDA